MPAAVLLVGGTLRLVSAVRAPLDLIEVDEFIPAAMTLSWEHHPIRATQHGAVPIYFIRASALIFGDSDLGFRMLSVVAGTATILLVYLIAARWWGAPSGLAAAALLALERYHTTISARAIDLPFDLLFVALAMFCFSRFLHGIDGKTEAAVHVRWLYDAAAATALGFLCKELTALMLPVLLLSLVFLRQTAWLRRREPWIAVGLFLLLICPDVYSNLTVTRAERMDLLARQEEAARQRGTVYSDPEYLENGLYMSYGDQLSRFRSLGLSAEPFYFYFGEILDRAGIPHNNPFGEFPYLNPLMGVALWVGVALSLARRNKDRVTVFLLTMFFVMFLPFTLVQLGAPRARFPTDPQALWYWVDRTMLPALLLTGYAVGAGARRLTGRASVAPATPA